MLHTVYHVNANELNHQFLESLKTLFQDKEIEIIVSVVDETEYLLQSSANKQRLLRAIENIEAGQSLVPVAEDALR